MPSFLDEEREPKISTKPANLQTNRASATPLGDRSAANKDVSDNGSNGNLMSKTLSLLPNGSKEMDTLSNGRLQDGSTKPKDPASLQKGVNDGNTVAPKERVDRNRTSYTTLTDGSGRVGDGRDDGFFATMQQGDETQSRWVKATHVKLEATTMNGANTAQDSPLVDSPTNVHEGTHAEPISNPVNKNAPSTYPPAQSFQDSSLGVPGSSVHRVSSPPAFSLPLNSSTTSTLTTSSHPGPLGARLQHRHTLEVPKVSTARASKEFTNANASEDVLASGRFSPSTPTRRRGSMNLVRRATRSINSDMHLDEIPQDEDAVRWAEHIRQKRASKRRKQEEEDEDRVLVGTKVDQNHVNWVTAYNMLTGIRFTVSRTNAKIDRELTDVDFDTKHKFSFDM
jgi:1-phosphatidylinositol-4-phosphate 5-kinase